METAHPDSSSWASPQMSGTNREIKMQLTKTIASNTPVGAGLDLIHVAMEPDHKRLTETGAQMAGWADRVPCLPSFSADTPFFQRVLHILSHLTARGTLLAHLDLPVAL